MAVPQVPSRRQTRAVHVRTCCPSLKAGPGSERLLRPDAPHPQSIFVMWRHGVFHFSIQKTRKIFLLQLCGLVPYGAFLSHVCTSVCVTERDRAHTCEATEAVTQHLSPSQPQELVLRTDREMGEGRGDRAASTSVAASGPEDRAQRPPRCEVTSCESPRGLASPEDTRQHTPSQPALDCRAVTLLQPLHKSPAGRGWASTERSTEFCLETGADGLL